MIEAPRMPEQEVLPPPEPEVDPIMKRAMAMGYTPLPARPRRVY
jgi:hypothetical protein